MTGLFRRIGEAIVAVVSPAVLLPSRQLIQAIGCRSESMPSMSRLFKEPCGLRNTRQDIPHRDLRFRVLAEDVNFVVVYAARRRDGVVRSR